MQHSKSAALICQSSEPTLAHSATTSLPSPPLSAGSHYSQGFGGSKYPPSEVVNSWPSTQEHFLASLISDHVPSTQCVHVINTPPSPPVLTPTDNMVSDPMRELTGDTAVSKLPSPAQEHIPTLPSLSDHVQNPSRHDQQCINPSSTPSSSIQVHAPTSQPFPSRVMTPPDKLHLTLSCWIKNMNKLSGLVDRLHELASSAPAEYRSRLLRQAAELRATSKKQKEHFTEFLQLSEEYANRYLLDISDEIKQQSSFLEKLEGRLEAAKKLRGEAIDLQKLYESGTAATMKDLCATGNAASYHLQTPEAKYRNFIFSTLAATSRGPNSVQRGGFGADRD